MENFRVIIVEDVPLELKGTEGTSSIVSNDLMHHKHYLQL